MRILRKSVHAACVSFYFEKLNNSYQLIVFNLVWSSCPPLEGGPKSLISRWGSVVVNKSGFNPTRTFSIVDWENLDKNN